MRRTDEAFKRELFRRYGQYKKNRRNLRILAVAPCALSILLIFALVFLPRLSPWLSTTPVSKQPNTTTTGTTTTPPVTDPPHDPAADLPHDPDNPLAGWLREPHQHAYETRIYATYSYRKDGQNYSYATVILSPHVVEDRIAQISEFLRTIHMGLVEEGRTPSDGSGIAFTLEDWNPLREKIECNFFLQDQYLYFDDWYDNKCYMISQSDADTLISMLDGGDDYKADTDPLARVIAEGYDFGRLEYIYYNERYLDFRGHKEAIQTLTDFLSAIELTDVDWQTVVNALSQAEPINRTSIYIYYDTGQFDEEFTISLNLYGRYLALERNGYIYLYEIADVYAEYLVNFR